MLDDTYAYVRARWVILVWIVGLAAPVLVWLLLFPCWRYAPNSSIQPLENAVLTVAIYGLIGAQLWLIWGQNLGRKEIFGSSPSNREAWIYVSLGIPWVGASLVGIDLLYLPFVVRGPWVRLLVAA